MGDPGQLATLGEGSSVRAMQKSTTRTGSGEDLWAKGGDGLRAAQSEAAIFAP